MRRPGFKRALSRLKQSLLSPGNRHKTMLAGCVALIALLVIILCIINSMRVNMQNEYSKARGEIGDELYSQLYTMCQTFDQVSIPGQNVQDVLLPRMRSCYDAALTLNTAVGNAFSEKYRVLEQEDVDTLNAAFDAYDEAFRTGTSTSTAEEKMGEACARVRALLGRRYTMEGLKPR